MIGFLSNFFIFGKSKLWKYSFCSLHSQNLSLPVEENQEKIQKLQVTGFELRVKKQNTKYKERYKMQDRKTSYGLRVLKYKIRNIMFRM